MKRNANRHVNKIELFFCQRFFGQQAFAGFGNFAFAADHTQVGKFFFG